MNISVGSKNVPYNLIISSEIVYIIFQMSFISDDASISKKLHWFACLVLILLIWFFSLSCTINDFSICYFNTNYDSLFSSRWAHMKDCINSYNLKCIYKASCEMQ